MNFGTALVLTIVIAVACAALRSVIMKKATKSCCGGCGGCEGCCSAQECCDRMAEGRPEAGKAASARA